MQKKSFNLISMISDAVNYVARSIYQAISGLLGFSHGRAKNSKPNAVTPSQSSPHAHGRSTAVRRPKQPGEVDLSVYAHLVNFLGVSKPKASRQRSSVLRTNPSKASTNPKDRWLEDDRSESGKPRHPPKLRR